MKQNSLITVTGIILFLNLFPFIHNKTLANATIQVTFQNTPYGTWTPQAMAAFNHATHIWEQTITSSQIIHVHATFEDLYVKNGNNPFFKNVLGAARSSTYASNFSSSDPRYDVNYHYALCLAEKLKGSGINNSGYPHEIMCNFNSYSGVDWYFGTDGNTPSNKLDFVTVILHEIGHGIGFYSSAIKTTKYTAPVSTAGFEYIAIYDKFIKNSAGKSPMDFFVPTNTNFSFSTDQYLTSQDLTFTGNTATWNLTWSSNVSPPLFVPTSYKSGSSISHFDEDYFHNLASHNGNNLMTPTTGWGESQHDCGWIGIGLLQDIGWDGNLYLGNNEIKHDLELSVYPNPCINNIKIATPIGINIKEVKIISISGTINIRKMGNGINMDVDVSKLAPGLYIVKAIDILGNESYNLISKQ